MDHMVKWIAIFCVMAICRISTQDQDDISIIQLHNNEMIFPSTSPRQDVFYMLNNDIIDASKLCKDNTENIKRHSRVLPSLYVINGSATTDILENITMPGTYRCWSKYYNATSISKTFSVVNVTVSENKILDVSQYDTNKYIRLECGIKGVKRYEDIHWSYNHNEDATVHVHEDLLGVLYITWQNTGNYTCSVDKFVHLTSLVYTPNITYGTPGHTSTNRTSTIYTRTDANSTTATAVPVGGPGYRNSKGTNLNAVPTITNTEAITTNLPSSNTAVPTPTITTTRYPDILLGIITTTINAMTANTDTDTMSTNPPVQTHSSTIPRYQSELPDVGTIATNINAVPAITQRTITPTLAMPKAEATNIIPASITTTNQNPIFNTIPLAYSSIAPIITTPTYPQDNLVYTTMTQTYTTTTPLDTTSTYTKATLMPEYNTPTSANPALTPTHLMHASIYANAPVTNRTKRSTHNKVIVPENITQTSTNTTLTSLNVTPTYIKQITPGTNMTTAPTHAMGTRNNTNATYTNAIVTHTNVISKHTTSIPVDTNTISTYTNTMPTYTRSIPSNTNTISADQKTIPRHTSAIQSPTTTMPTSAMTMPTYTSTIPLNTNTIPTYPNTFPSHTSAIPSPATTMATYTNTMPSNTHTIQSNTNMTPTYPNTIPSNTSAISSPATKLSTYPNTMPSDTSPIPSLATKIPKYTSTIPSKTEVSTKPPNDKTGTLVSNKTPIRHTEPVTQPTTTRVVEKQGQEAKIKATKGQIYGVVGEKVTLECVRLWKGNNVKIDWRLSKNTDYIKSNDKYHFQESDQWRLTIWNLTRNDMNNYTCLIDGRHDRKSEARIELIVLDQFQFISNSTTKYSESDEILFVNYHNCFTNHSNTTTTWYVNGQKSDAVMFDDNHFESESGCIQCDVNTSNRSLFHQTCYLKLKTLKIHHKPPLVQRVSKLKDLDFSVMASTKPLMNIEIEWDSGLMDMMQSATNVTLFKQDIPAIKFELYPPSTSLQFKKLLQVNHGNFSCNVSTSYGQKRVITTQVIFSDPAHQEETTMSFVAPTITGCTVLIFCIVICIVKRKSGWFKKKIYERRLMRMAAKEFDEIGLSIRNQMKSRYVSVPKPNEGFPRQRLRILEVLGEGNFGKVVKAEALDINGNGVWETVAIKMCKETATDSQKEDFAHELALVKQIPKHTNVVNYLGYCQSADQPTLMILEYVSGGNLLQFLRKRRPNIKLGEDALEPLDSSDLSSFAYQIAKGLEHLSNNNIIHRDIAARNILITENNICKVADLGLARDLHDSGAYEIASKGVLPIRWMAPESLTDGIYTSKSDVWSFGILLWEIVTLGASPYPGMSARQVMSAVVGGDKLECPDFCSKDLQSLIMQCWGNNPNQRPSFSEICHILELLLEEQTDYLNLQNYEEGLYAALFPTTDDDEDK